MKKRDTERHTGSRAFREPILAHFRNRPLKGCGQHFQDSVYQLLRAVLEHRDFDSLESLIEYCRNHDNLRAWLLHEADRVMFSAELTHGLRDMVGKTRPSPPSESKLE